MGVEIGEKLPSHIGTIVQRVISLNSPEKIEVEAGNKICLVIFSHLPEQECVNISGFDISGQKELDSLGMQLITSLVDQLDGELELKRDNGTEFIIRFAITGNDDQELTPA